MIRVEDYRYSIKRYYSHAVTVLLRMQPSESDEHADLLLTLDSKKVKKI